MLPAEQSAQYAFAMRHSPAPLAFSAENSHFNSLFRGQAVSDTDPARKFLRASTEGDGHEPEK